MRSFIRNFILPIHPLYLLTSVAVGIVHSMMEHFIFGLSLDAAQACGIITSLQVAMGLWLGDKLVGQPRAISRWILGNFSENNRQSYAWQLHLLARVALVMGAIGIGVLVVSIAGLYILWKADMMSIYRSGLMPGAFFISVAISHVIVTGRENRRQSSQTL